jgi:predicted HAD superfamily Cof-like phosphohydrolase
LLNAIKEIYRFQVEAGLAEQEYDDFRESAYQIEEALEGFDLNSFSDIDIDFDENTEGAKELSRKIVKIAMNSGNEAISDVDRLDKAVDAIVFAIGSMAKLGLNPQQINEALLIVNKANMTKLKCHKDEHGKLTKPDNWEQYAPEIKLQELLNKVQKKEI